MINWDNIFCKLRGIFDDGLTMYLIMQHNVVSAQKELNTFHNFIKYMNNKEDWMNWKVDGKFPELPEHLSPYYQKYMKFIKEHTINECYDILRSNIIKETDNLDEWSKDAYIKFKGLKGKVTCIEDYQKNGTRWIINEVLITNLITRFMRTGDTNEEAYINMLGYSVMASRLCGQNLLKKRWQDFDNDLDIYKSIEEDLKIYNLK